MKCPKCGYLGFEAADRCRNCGYDFSLAPPAVPPVHDALAGRAGALDFALNPESEETRPALDLDRIIGAPEPDAAGDLPLFSPPQGEHHAPAPPARRTRAAARSDDAPLISAPSRPRAPLGVRRATTEVPRAKPRTTRPAMPREEPLFEAPPAAVIGHAVEHAQRTGPDTVAPAAPWRRVVAGLVDVTLLSAVDAIVVYLTVRLLGLPTAEMFALPLLPLAAFFLLLNGGYFVAFTAVGGQSIGKMAAGIKVVGQEHGDVPVGQATLRTLAYLASALPLGAGFLSGIVGADRLALHDRLAHTRVIRQS